MPAGVAASDFYYLLPEIVLTAGALLVLCADLVVPRNRQSVLAAVTLGVLGATILALWPVIWSLLEHLRLSKRHSHSVRRSGVRQTPYGLYAEFQTFSMWITGATSRASTLSR